MKRYGAQLSSLATFTAILSPTARYTLRADRYPHLGRCSTISLNNLDRQAIVSRKCIFSRGRDAPGPDVPRSARRRRFTWQLRCPRGERAGADVVGNRPAAISTDVDIALSRIYLKNFN